MLGLNGEPWQTIEGFDDSGEILEIQLHNAHSFPDGGGFWLHYINPATRSITSGISEVSDADRTCRG